MDWHKYVEVDPRYLRPAEVDLLLGDPSKARKVLNWQPRISFQELVAMMVDADWKLAKEEKILVSSGLKTNGGVGGS